MFTDYHCFRDGHHSWLSTRGEARPSERQLRSVLSLDEHHVAGAQAGRVVARARPGRLALAPVLPGQVEAHGADAEEEEQASGEQQHDAGDPEGLRLLRRRAEHNQDDARAEQQSPEAAGQHAQVEVSLGRPRLLLVVGVRRAGHGDRRTSASRRLRDETAPE